MISHKVSSCIDISDGLIFDSFKLASNSECGVEISSSKIPISLKALQSGRGGSHEGFDLRYIRSRWCLFGETSLGAGL